MRRILVALAAVAALGAIVAVAAPVASRVHDDGLATISIR